MTRRCQILAIAPNDVNWIVLGEDRAQAEGFYRRAIAERGYQKPLYRVIATRKPSASETSITN